MGEKEQEFVKLKYKEMNKKPDNRVCYGALCTWFGSIYHTSRDKAIPTCPVCGGILFETTSKEWAAGIARAEKSHPGYAAFIDWLADKHFDSYDDAKAAYPGPIAGWK